MERIEDLEQKEEEIMDIIMQMSKWWHRWEEDRNGQKVVCIEYAPSKNALRKPISADGNVT